MIDLKAVTFGYGKRSLFEGLDLSMAPGTCYGLLGLNGAGKTSMLKLMAGALIPDSGTIRVFGRDPSKRSAAHCADVYFAPEDPLAPKMTVDAWLMNVAVFRPNFEEAYFRRLLRQFELDRLGKISTWSYGQRKKFSIAAAIASGARALFLDEPTNGLDIPGKAQFRSVLSSLSDNPDRLIVLSTHQVRDLESIMDPIIIVRRDGDVVQASMERLSACLSVQRLAELDGRPIVIARKDAVGWIALIAEPGPSLDLEMVFEAAISRPQRLQAALEGTALPIYNHGEEVVR